MLKIISQANLFLNKPAIVVEDNQYTYAQLLDASSSFAHILLNGERDLNEARVAFITAPGFEYVMCQWAIWQAGGTAVPLCISYPNDALQYVIEDTAAEIIIADEIYFQKIEPLAQTLNKKLITTKEVYAGTNCLPEISRDRRAMILYTSGTTSKPKGVVSTHKNIESQISTLVDAWRWTSQDHTLNVLPLHHVHGIINIVSCALWSGATVQFLNNFSPQNVFEILVQGKVNVFMAVPTIYYKLISYYDEAPSEMKDTISNRLSKMRLMVSGSAALPVSVLERWQKISKHTLLERYGMTEIGMGISNPYEGNRKAGYIGQALPGVEVRLVDEDDRVLKSGEIGEIQIKSDSVFLAYWQRPKETHEAFTHDGWFKTGDVAVFEDGHYKILGRNSMDIIKSGGYKISAIEIEDVLRSYSDIVDCSVVGLPDEEWGEVIIAFLECDKDIDLSHLHTWIRDKLPAYKTPKRYIMINELPRNAMGKVTKNELKQLAK